MHSVGTLVQVRAHAALPIDNAIVQLSVNVDPSSEYEKVEGRAAEEQSVNNQSTHYIINSEEQHLVDYVEYDEIEAEMDMSAEHIELENEANMHIVIETLDVDESPESVNGSCNNAANRHDSDDDYEADLADKYEALDQAYHTKRTPGSPTNRGQASLVLNPDIMLSMTTAVVTERSECRPVTCPDAQQPPVAKNRHTEGSIINSDSYRQCYVCGLLVMRMRDHMKTHPDQLQFQCEICARSYLTKTGLDRHIDGHHPETR